MCPRVCLGLCFGLQGDVKGTVLDSKSGVTISTNKLRQKANKSVSLTIVLRAISTTSNLKQVLHKYPLFKTTENNEAGDTIQIRGIQARYTGMPNEM